MYMCSERGVQVVIINNALLITHWSIVIVIHTHTISHDPIGMEDCNYNLEKGCLLR